MISDNLVTAHAHNVIILYGATVNINPVSAPEDMFPVTEQRMIDQRNQIIENQWFSNFELEEIKHSVEDALNGLVEQELEYENRSEGLSDYVTGCGS